MLEVSDSNVIVLTWAEVHNAAARLIVGCVVPPTEVYGIPTGGSVVAALIADRYGLELLDELPEDPGPEVLIVDDLVDTGATLRPYTLAYPNATIAALYRKPYSPGIASTAILVDSWLAFPWEHRQSPEDSVVRLLQYIGEDPTREGLLETPARYVKALGEMTSGLGEDPAAHLLKTFEGPETPTQVTVHEIPFESLCEHHLLPFTGWASVSYLPAGRVVGLSKIARMVRGYARRPQIQERLTQQILMAMVNVLEPRNVQVEVHARHSCMSCRGVGVDAAMLTEADWQRPSVRLADPEL